MKKKYLSFIILFHVHFAISQTVLCDYIQLEFVEITPLWTHLTIDSSIIGWVDTCGTVKFDYPDGMEHLTIDGGSFVEGGYVYSFAKSRIDRDISGVVAEKIDLMTGELQWQIVDDIRTVPYREQVFRGGVEDDKFVIYGLREAEPFKTSSNHVAFMGQLDGIYYKREYDLETGELLSYQTPEEGDTLAQKNKKYTYATNSYFDLDSSVHFLDARNFLIGKGFFLIREVIDNAGYLLSGPDTVVIGRFGDRKLLEGNLVKVNQFQKSPENTYIYIEQYSPRVESDYSYEGIITEYDKEFNVVRELDLKAIGLDTFSQLRPVRVTEDYILIKGCYNLNFDHTTYCEEFYLVLDRDFKLSYRFEPKVAGEEELGWFQEKNIIRKEGNTFYIPVTTFKNVGQTQMIIYRTTDEGFVEQFKTITIKESEWVSFVEHFSILANGDFLMKLTHSCYLNGTKRSWHPEWFRFAAKDIEGLSNEESVDQIRQQLILSPNPVMDRLRIESEELLSGTLEIYDVHGKRVSVNKVGGISEKILDISTLDAGTYFLTLRREGEELLTQSFVKL